MDAKLTVFFLIGFGLQQFLQVIVDPLASVLITRYTKPAAEPGGTPGELPGGISITDAKKVILGITALALGWIIVASSGEQLLLLKILGVSAPQDLLDQLVSALALGAGTEGANSILKLLQYAKEAVKLRTPERGAQDSPVRRAAGGSAGHEQEPEADRDETPNFGDDSAAAIDSDDEVRPEAAETADGETLPGARTAPAPWRAAESLLKLRDQVNRLAPHRSKRSDGLIGDAAHASRESDHNPWVRDGNRGVVTAIDITHDPARGCDAGKIAEAIRSSQDPRVKYIIYNRRIASSAPRGGQPAWAWRSYTGPNPHRSHVHISVQPQKRLYDDTRAWRL